MLNFRSQLIVALFLKKNHTVNANVMKADSVGQVEH